MAVQPKKRHEAAPRLQALAAKALGEQARIARQHIQGAIRGTDPEHLHDLRVAVRRMRAALRLFERGLPLHRDAMKAARVDLRESGRILGAARDLDVQVFRIRAALGAQGKRAQSALARILALLESDRAKARGAMVHFLTAGIFDLQLSRVEGLSQGLRPPANTRRRSAKKAPPQPARLLRRPIRRAMSAISAVRTDPRSPEKFHVLRIEVKRLRYAVEFLGAGLPFARIQFLRKMRAAQDQLGALQDATVELALAADLKQRLAEDREANALITRFAAVRGRDHRRLLLACKRLLGPLEAEVRTLAKRVERADG